MKKNIAVITSLIFFGIALISSCSTQNQTKSGVQVNEQKTDKTSSAVAKSHGSYYTILQFEKGTYVLSETSKKELKDFVAKVEQDGRSLNEIKILAWADNEYPDKGELTKSDVEMANNRTESIEKYLKTIFSTNPDFTTYNMAKRPSVINELLHTDEFTTKNIFEKSGAMSTSFNDNTITLYRS